ncbi:MULTISPECIES: hypothetical protein [Saccharothrix]|uniref:hypothetical protein n=1 Tax=Saccharothrix TaxID=2071 RepID=UPI0018E9B3E6|nr:hypothetical protein [Saccharothrix sp. CB00851]
MRYLVAVVVIALGIAAVVFGEADDSPGLQGIGALLVLGTLAYTARATIAARRRR